MAPGAGAVKRLILHVGQHKTGSKALQAFLSHNRAVLLRRGILYPRGSSNRRAPLAYAVSHYLSFALLRHQLEGGSGSPPALCQPFSSLSQWLALLAAAPAHTVILSAEDLFDMSTAHELDFSLSRVEAGARALSKLAANYNFRAEVVVYLRRQDHLLCSQYGELIKGHPDSCIGFEEFRSAFAPRLRPLPILARWASAFGVEQVHPLAYDPTLLAQGVAVDFFRQAVGMEIPKDCRAPAVHPELDNRAIHRDYVELVRLMQQLRRTEPPRWAIIEAAQRSGVRAEVKAWLSPGERRQLLQAHSLENDEIARLYRVGRSAFFPEPEPPDDPGWAAYPGLSAERAVELLLESHAIRQAWWTRIGRHGARGLAWMSSFIRGGGARP